MGKRSRGARWFDRTGVKLLLSLLAAALLALDLMDLVVVDAATLDIAALVVLAWRADILETAELPGGWRVKFREVTAEQERLGREVGWLQFLMRKFLTQYEARHLQEFASAEPFWIGYDDPTKSYFDRELRRLLDLNLIERLPNRGIRNLLYDARASGR